MGVLPLIRQVVLGKQYQPESNILPTPVPRNYDAFLSY